MGPDFVFVHGSTGQPSHVIDKGTGKIRSTFDQHYACTRFTFSKPYLIGPNVDTLWDLSDSFLQDPFQWPEVWKKNPEYFERLHGFLELASQKGVIVELTLFSNTYGDAVWAPTGRAPPSSCAVTMQACGRRASAPTGKKSYRALEI